MSTFTIVTGYTWTNGEVVTATKLNLAASPTLASDQSYTFNAGAAATPSINFTGATTTGFYLGSSSIGFSVGGASAATLSASTFSFGIGGTGTTALAVNINGGSGSTGGGYVQFLRNSVSKGAIGTESAVIGNNSDDFVIYAGANNMKLYAGGLGASTFGATGLVLIGSLTTSAPTTGTAGAWKMGIRVAATVALDTTQYIQLDVGGTLYKLAVVT